MRMFTPWEMNVSARMRAHLEAAGAPVPSGHAYPPGVQFAEALLDPLAALPALAGRTVLLVGAGKSAQTAAGTSPRSPSASPARGSCGRCAALSRTGVSSPTTRCRSARGSSTSPSGWRAAGGEAPAVEVRREWRSSRSRNGTAGWRSRCAALPGTPSGQPKRSWTGCSR
ncbi:MAG: hypothetical protein ACRDYX_03980 [Egibacteraceae bacterium]